MQRLDETRQVIREMQARKIRYVDLRDALYALAFIGADSTAMSEQLQWFAGEPEYASEALAMASATEAYGGHLGKARELTKRAVDIAIRADSKENGAIYQANAALEQAAYGNRYRSPTVGGRSVEARSHESGSRSRSCACVCHGGRYGTGRLAWRKTWESAFRWTRRCSRFGCPRFGRNWRWTKRIRLPP